MSQKIQLMDLSLSNRFKPDKSDTQRLDVIKRKTSI